ncbi:54S ribosomal protein L8, mitochondrial [Malassezia sp. CBS 17886]|nr:54S ribosomal protein L8, mitochondrial [Malassezia sp. CBS 17886]
MKGHAFRKLSRSSSHRNHLLRNLVTSLLSHERIVTTVAKAKEASRCAEKIITLGKRGTPTALSGAQSFLYSLPRLAELSHRYADRPGGYTRVHLMGHRKGDHAPRAVLELVDNPTDVRLDMTARSMAREAHVLLKRARKNIGFSALRTLVAAQADVPLEHDTRFAPLTRKNIAKLVQYRGDEARRELSAKAAMYLEHREAADAVEGPRRPDDARWDKMELARPSRGRTLTRPMVGRRMVAGEIPLEMEAQVGTVVEKAQPIRRHDGSVAPVRMMRIKKPSVVRLGKGVFAKRYSCDVLEVPELARRAADAPLRPPPSARRVDGIRFPRLSAAAVSAPTIVSRALSTSPHSSTPASARDAPLRGAPTQRTAAADNVLLEQWSHVYNLRWEPSATAHAAALAIPERLPYAADAADILDTLREALHSTSAPDAPPTHTLLAMVQEALARAYTTVLSPFHAEGAAGGTHPDGVQTAALDILGLAAEALVALRTPQSFVLARKLLSYAQQHVGAVGLVHFHRMMAHLGASGYLEMVLQLAGIANTHHAGREDPRLVHARALALLLQGQTQAFLALVDGVADACAAAGRPIPYEHHELVLWYHLQRGECERVTWVLRALAAGHGRVDTSTWLLLLYANIPLHPALLQLRRTCSDMGAAPSAALLDSLLHVLLSSSEHSRHVPWVAALFQAPVHGQFGGVPCADALAAQLPDAVAASVPRAALPALTPSTAAMAATWCGRRGMPQAALSFFRQVLASGDGADATPLPNIPNELRAPHLRSGVEAAKQHAAAGVVQAYTRAGDPVSAARFAMRVVGVDLPVAPVASEACLAALPARCVQRSSVGSAALLECAGALSSVDVARAALKDATGYGMKMNGRIRRALAQLLLRCVGGHRGEMQYLRQFLSQHFEWVGGRAQDACDPDQPAQERLRKFCEALAAFGFEEEMQLARATEDRRRRTASFRTGTRQPRRAEPGPDAASLHLWVRDTPLQPLPETSVADRRRAAPRDAARAPAVERTSAGYAARLEFLTTLVGDQDGAQALFRTMIQEGRSPTVRHILPLVRGLCRTGRMREAQWIMRTALPAWQIPPTRAMYTALIQAYVEVDDWAAVARELEDMRRRSIEPGAFLQDLLATTTTARASADDAHGVPETPIRVSKADDDAVPAHSRGSVAQHFQLLLRRQEFLNAQQFFAQCLDRGMAPDYAIRRLLKRSGNWMRKQLLSTAPVHARTLHDALALHEENTRRASFEQHPAARPRVLEQRAFRDALLGLVHDTISGRLEQQVKVAGRGPADEREKGTAVP